jgi:SAM-dependent methyltransferase
MSEPNNDNLQKVTEEKKYVGLDTATGVERYAQELGFKNEGEFIQYIEGKKVCDIGSGYGAFGVECILRGINVEIIGVNPNIGRSSFAMYQEGTLLRRFESTFTKEQILSAIEQYNNKTLATFAHDLSDIPSDSQDIILENRAVTFYSGEIGAGLYKKSLLEMIRVLKPGGKLRIGDRTSYGWEVLSSNEQILKDLELNYSVIYDSENPSRPLGVEVIK